MNNYKITFTKQELDRIWYVFNEELKDHKDNIQKGFIGYEGCLEDTKLILKKIKKFYK
jgi:hypothetical protein